MFRFTLPILGLLAPAAVRRALGSLNLFLAYLDELQTFSSTETRKLLATAGLKVPSPASYLNVVLRYYRDRKAGVEPSPASALENSALRT